MVETPSFEEPLSPMSSIQELQQQSKDKHQLFEWLTIMKKMQSHIDSFAQGMPHYRSLITDFEKVQTPVVGKIQDAIEIEGKSTTKIDFDDAKDEITYWENAIVCFVVGANPPFQVMEGFIRRIWGKLGIDKVATIRNGLFIVRMKMLEQLDAIIAGGFQFFDRKLVVVKAWHPDMDLQQ